MVVLPIPVSPSMTSPLGCRSADSRKSVIARNSTERRINARSFDTNHFKANKIYVAVNYDVAPCYPPVFCS